MNAMSSAKPAVVLHRARLVDTDEVLLCRDGLTLLAGMEVMRGRGVPVGCRGGGCGVCKVKVLSGQYDVLPMSRSHVSAEGEAAGEALACRLLPRGDLEIRVLGRMGRRLMEAPRAAAAGPTLHTFDKETTTWQSLA
jgi:ferredoxin